MKVRVRQRISLFLRQLPTDCIKTVILVLFLHRVTWSVLFRIYIIHKLSSARLNVRIGGSYFVFPWKRELNSRTEYSVTTCLFCF